MAMEIVFDFDRWNLVDYKDFIDLQNAPDEERETELLVKAISRWSMGTPVSVESFDELEMSLFSEILGLMQSQLKEMIDEKPTVTYTVDLSAWKMRDFKAYRRSLRLGDYDTTLAMLNDAGVPCNEDSTKIGVEEFFNIIKVVSKEIEANQKK